MARKSLPTSKRAAIWQAHERRCVYCTELVQFADLDVDHIIPSNLKEKPEELRRLLKGYGLRTDFDIDSLFNLVPSHRHCNLQKKGKALKKSRTLYFLSIAEERHAKASKIESELKEQALRDKFTILLQIALDEGRISREELGALVTRYTESRNVFEVLTTLPFVDSELKGFLSSNDVDSLYDRPILPRLYGLEKLTMVRTSLVNKEKIEVCTCREWAEAVRDGFRPRTTYDIKEETHFKNVYALIAALACAKVPPRRFITDHRVSIAHFDLLPVTLLPVFSGDDVKELQRLRSAGIGMADLVIDERVKIVSSSPLSLTLHYEGMGLYLYEILRADLNDDGIEDLLVGSYQWALEGTFGAGCTMVLTRLGIDQPFTVVEDIKLGVTDP